MPSCGTAVIKIHFAHRTFRWTSEARGKAHVHCVIIGFAAFDQPGKCIYDYDQASDAPSVIEVPNISPYLFSGPDKVLQNLSKPLCPVPKMIWGNKPTDGGNLILSDEEKREFLKAEPGAEKWIRPYTGATEFLYGIPRWCLWLPEITPQELNMLVRVKQRVEAVRTFRNESDAESTRKYAAYPTLFRQIAQPSTNYILVPLHTSESRSYIPFAFVSPEVIASNACSLIPNGSLFGFGILTSMIHMAWVRQFCGRLESRYRYSSTLVYNNFPWPTDATPAQRTKVQEAAQAVLDAREQFPGSTLADLYDPVSMPPKLAKAHEHLDRAADRCYRKEPFLTDRQRVEYLFALYEQLTAPLVAAPRKPSRRRPAPGPAGDAMILDGGPGEP